jgi:hypothetical protein
VASEPAKNSQPKATPQNNAVMRDTDGMARAAAVLRKN